MNTVLVKKKRRLTQQFCFICGSTRESSASLFRFPKNSTRSVWLKFVDLPENSDTDHLHLCSKHFADVDLKRETNRNLLRDGAVPTLLPSVSRKPCADRQVRCILCKGKDTTASSESFHSAFPNDVQLREKWANFCGIPANQVTQHIRLCSRHFKDEDVVVKLWMKEQPRKKLKSTAVPSIHVENDFLRIRQRTRSADPVLLRKVLTFDDHLLVVNKIFVSERFKHEKEVTLGAPSSRSRIMCYLCSNNRNNVPYFRFPKNDEQNSQWRRICKLSDKIDSDKLALCGIHFSDEEKIVHLTRTNLKDSAVPTLHLVGHFTQLPLNAKEAPSSVTSSTVNSKPDEPLLYTRVSDHDYSRNVSTDDSQPLPQEGSVASSTTLSASVPRTEQEPPSSPPTNITPTPASEVQTPTRGKNSARRALRYFGDVRPSDLSSPRRAQSCWAIARKTITQKNQQIKRNQEEITRLRNKLNSLTKVVEDLLYSQCEDEPDED